MEINTGEYIYGSIEVKILIDEMKNLKERILFVKKAAKLNFPVEERYVESLSSKVKEYKEIYYAALDKESMTSFTLKKEYFSVLKEVMKEYGKFVNLTKDKGAKE